MGYESGLEPALQLGMIVFPAFTVTPLGHPEDPLAMMGQEQVMTGGRVVAAVVEVVVVFVVVVVARRAVEAFRPAWAVACCPHTFKK